MLESQSKAQKTRLKPIFQWKLQWILWPSGCTLGQVTWAKMA